MNSELTCPADIAVGIWGQTPPWNPEPVPHIIIQLFAYRILEFRADLAPHLGADLAVGLNTNLTPRQFLERGRWSKSNPPTHYYPAFHRWDT